MAKTCGISSIDVDIDLGMFGWHTAKVVYEWSAGFRGTLFEPPEPPDFRLEEVIVDGYPDLLPLVQDDPVLLAELVAVVKQAVDDSQ